MRRWGLAEEERRAQERADLSENALHVFIAAALLVAAFCAFMIWTSP